MKLLTTAALALGVLFGLPGCIIHARHHPGDAHPEWTIVKGHAHDAHCGHYFWRGKWRVLDRHVHGHGCGHVHRDGIWILVD
ncbi:MAG: hypothetical protein HYY16_09515 [Planctomycetes bacterium]|nr:hypothetical protein [Planctomycetota bacterium]